MVYLFTIDIGKSWKKTEQRGSQADNGLKSSQVEIGRNWQPSGFARFLLWIGRQRCCPWRNERSADGSQADNGLKGGQIENDRQWRPRYWRIRLKISYEVQKIQVQLTGFERRLWGFVRIFIFGRWGRRGDFRKMRGQRWGLRGDFRFGVFLVNPILLTLMANALEHFRNITLNAFGVDPVHYITTPQMEYSYFLKVTMEANHGKNALKTLSEKWAQYIIRINTNEELTEKNLEKIFMDRMDEFYRNKGIWLMEKNEIDDFIRLLKNLWCGITQIVKRHAKVDIDNKEQTTASKEGIYNIDANNLYLEPCIEWCLMSWWMCLNENRWWRRSIEIRSNRWNHSTHLTSMDTSSNVISKHTHNSMISSMTFLFFQYRRQVCTQMESRDMLKRITSWTSERTEYTEAHLWSCTSLKVSSPLLTPSTGHTTGISCHSHSSHHSIQTGSIHIRICEHVERETSEVQDHCGKEPVQVVGNLTYGKFVETGLKRMKVKFGNHLEWTRGHHPEAWIWYDCRNNHVFRESHWYQVEYTCVQGGETILHRICHSGRVQTHHIRVLYNVFKNTFDNVELLRQDTDSLIVQLSDKGNIVHKMCEMYQSFDFSKLDNTSYFYRQLMNYYKQEVDKSKFPSLSSFLNFNKKLPGPVFKDERNGHRITEFVGLRLKMYCLVDEKHVIHNTTKGVPRNLEVESKKDVVIDGSLKRINNQGLNISTMEQTKTLMTYIDNKKWTCVHWVCRLIFSGAENAKAVVWDWRREPWSLRLTCPGAAWIP